MQIIISHDHIELTEAIKDYVEDKMSHLFDYDDSLQIANVRVGKESNHHKKGEVFYCKAHITAPGANYNAHEQHEDLYAAITACKDVLYLEITKHNDKRASRRDVTDEDVAII